MRASFVTQEIKLIHYCGQQKEYSKHPNILRIKQYFKNPTEFSFLPVDKDVIAKENKNLNTKKAAPR